MSIYTQILQGVKWNAFESIAYQILLCSHRFVLYKVLGPNEFGFLGCVFASIYGLIFLINFGFNDSLNAFFLEIFSSKNTCRIFLIKYGIPHFILLITFPFAVRFFPYHAISLLPLNIFIVAGLLFIAESLRITLRAFLQLTFINRQLACIDLLGLCLYIIIIWSIWLYGFQLTTYIVLIPLAIISYFQVLILVGYARTWYMNLSLETCNLPSYKRIIRIRLFAYMQHTASSHFMSNFIIPYSAYIWGLEYASLVKLITSTSQLITTFLKHTIGFSSIAFFAHLKNASHNEKHFIFKLMNNLIFAIIFLTILLCITLYALLGSYLELVHLHSGIVVLFFIALICESFFIPCESAYLSEEKPEIVAIIYSIGIAMIYMLFHYHVMDHILIFISSFLMIRLLSLSFLTVTLINRWKISQTEN